MSEHFQGAGFPNAFAGDKKLHRLLAEDEVNAVDYMWGFFGAEERQEAGLIEIHFTGTGFVRYLTTPSFFVAGHYFRHAWPGDSPVRAVSSAPAVLATTVVGRDQLSKVMINDDDEALEAQVGTT